MFTPIKEYTNEANSITEGIRKKSIQAKKELHLRQFWVTTANMRNFLPTWFEKQDPETVFLNYLCEKPLAALDQQFFERIKETRISGYMQDVILDRISPRIFCSFHLGSYRLIIGYLAYLGYDFSVVVNRAVFQNQAKEMEETVRKINTLSGVVSTFGIICADDFDATKDIYKAIKTGHSLIVYADGNTGVGGHFRKDEKMLKINFLNQQIYIRQGIPYISHLFNIPIVPVIPFRDGKYEMGLHFMPSIDSSNIKDRKVYCQQIMQLLYDRFSDWLSRYPLQWEGWSYIHRQLELNDCSTLKIDQSNSYDQSELRFNDSEFGLYAFGDDKCLMNLSSYQTYLLDEQEFQLLLSYWDFDKSFKKRYKQVSRDQLERLIDRRILITKKK